MAEFPAPEEGIVLTHFIVSEDVERSMRFYVDVLGGEVVREGEPAMVALANSWITDTSSAALCATPTGI
jgi:predicted enzyme related to lactoylglutathione lyase